MEITKQSSQSELTKEVQTWASLDTILTKVEEIDKLPLSERDYLYLYLNLENHVVNSLDYTADDLRSTLKHKFNTRWFPPRVRSLFESSESSLLIFTEIFVESVMNEIFKAAGITSFRAITNLTKGTMLDGLKINNNKIDFSFVDRKIYSDAQNYPRIVSEFHTILKSLNDFYSHNLGRSKTLTIFKLAFDNVKGKYSLLPQFSAMVKSLPSGLVDEERLNLLTKDELEKVSKKLARVDVMKSEFTNIAAHELITPLVPIIGYADMMLKNPRKYGLNKKSLDIIKIFSRNSHRLKGLVGEILDVSKLETGEMKFNMRQLILPPPGKRPTITADPDRLTQVLHNLVKNAIKFTDKGSITVLVTVKSNQLTISVQDTGVGLKQKDLDKVFLKFYQAQDVSTRKTKGTGLGLAISRMIVEAHQGKIWATSEGKGRGTTFHFTIPIKK
jgi:hypothetical protein